MGLPRCARRSPGWDYFASLCVPQSGVLQSGKSPSAVRQISICYSNPVVCFDHFPDVRKMMISIISDWIQMLWDCLALRGVPPGGVLQRRKSLMLRIRFFIPGCVLKQALHLPEIKKPGVCPAFSSLAVRGVLECLYSKHLIKCHRVSNQHFKNFE